jgi:protein SCO1/2
MSRRQTNPLFIFNTIIGVSGSGLVLLSVAALFLALPASSSVAATTIVSTTSSMSKADTDRARNYFTDTELITHDGENVRFYSDVLDGHIVMINAMYTDCIGACPLVTQKLSQVSRELGDLYGKDIYFVSISIDPENDTPEALSEFAMEQSVNLDGWTFLTGTKQKIDNVVKKIGLYTPNKEEHKAMILLGNTRTGRWQKVRPNIPYQAIAAKLKELVGGDLAGGV